MKELISLTRKMLVVEAIAQGFQHRQIHVHTGSAVIYFKRS
jgi:hypothetical protein